MKKLSFIAIGFIFAVFFSCQLSFAVEISAAQIQAIKNMSPEERQALARQLGIDPAQFSMSSSSQDDKADDDQAEGPALESRSMDAAAKNKRQKSVAKKSQNDQNAADEVVEGSSDSAQSMESAKKENVKNKKDNFTDQDSTNSDVNSDDVQDDKQVIERDKNKKPSSMQLKPFGYDLFAGEPSTFAPNSKIPVPTNYQIGPGDTVIIQLYGKENATHEIKVTREGVLQFPGIGPVSVNGLDFGAMRDQIQAAVARQMIGVKANVTMGPLRSMQVFVLGEAYRPGAYTVSALSTMTNALLVSGGIKRIGSLRDIQLKRNGKVITHFDFYDLLLHGDTSDDRRLLPGDVIFVPPVGKTVGIAGEVQRPAIYELKGEVSVDQLVKLAGGFLATAYPKAARIERINKSGERTFVDLDLASVAGRSKPLLNGDVLQVSPVLEQLEKTVLVSGYVNRPGGFAWRPGLRVSQVLRSVKNLKADPDLDFAWLKRQSGDRRVLKLLRIELGQALARPGSSADLPLQARDEIIVVGRSENHQAAIADIVDDLSVHAPIGQYAKTVTINGAVRFPGDYPLTESMRLADLVAASGNLNPESDLLNVLVASHNSTTGTVSVRRFDLANPADQRKRLAASDQVFIFGRLEDRKEYLKSLIATLKKQATKDQWQQVVRVEGSVRFPGEYPLLPNMAMQDLVELAGGFAEGAYADTAEVTRDVVVNSDEHRVIHEEINLRDPGVKGLAYALQSKDQLVIKQISAWGKVNFVTVSGEFKYPGRYPISEGETLSQLVKRAGGVTDQGDLDAAVFLRKSLKEKEDVLLKKMHERLQEDARRIEADAVNQAGTTIAQAKLESAKLLSQMKTAESSGRLVVDIKAAVTADKRSDVSLRDGDTIAVPKFVQEVSVLGEVQFPTSHVYRKNTEASDYVRLSGGWTQFADKKRAYVIHKNGQVEPIFKRVLIFFSYESDVQPGDTVVVPVSVEISSLTYWANISQVVFQLATTAAALQTVGIFK